MDVTVAILGRNTIDEPFFELGSQVVQLTDRSILFTPTIPPGAAGLETRVRVSAPDAVIFRTGRFIDPATRPGPSQRFDGNGNPDGIDPAPTPVLSDEYAIWGGAVTAGVPFHGPFASLIIGKPGVDVTAAGQLFASNGR